MKKNKILLFILLMIFSTNVYAYNWCKGGSGTNAYDFCSDPWLRNYDEGTSFDMGLNSSFNMQYNINFFRDFATPGSEQAYDFWWNDDEDEEGNPTTPTYKEQHRAQELEKIDYGNVTRYGYDGQDSIVMVYGSDLSNGFYSNIYLIKNDAYKNTFNNNVKVETQTYKNYSDTDGIGWELNVTVVTTPVLNSSGNLSGKTNKILVLKAFGGLDLFDLATDNFVKAGSNERKAFTDKAKANWPKEIYINKANVNVLSLTQAATNSIELSVNPKANWCTGGNGNTFYNFCEYTGTTASKLKDLIKAAQINQSTTKFRFGSKVQSRDGGLASLYIFKYDSSNKTVNDEVDVNRVYLNDSNNQSKFNNAVRSYSLSFTNINDKNEYINIYLYVTPILDSNGNINSTYTNRMINVTYNKTSGYSSIDNADLLKFNKTGTSDWPKTIYLGKDGKLSVNYDDNLYEAKIFSSVKNVDTNWCKGGTGKNLYDFCNVPIWKDQKIKNRTNGKGLVYNDGLSKNLHNGEDVFSKPSASNVTVKTFGDMLKSKNILFRSTASLNKNYFSNQGLLTMFGCENGNCFSNFNAITINTSEHYDIYTNRYLIVHPEYRSLFDSKVEVHKTTYISSANGTIEVTGVHIPIIENDGSIIHTQLLLRVININDKNIPYELTPAAAKSFNDFNHWPDVLSGMNTNISNLLKLESNKNNSIKFFRDGFNSEAFDVPFEQNECGGAAGIKQLIEDYLIKALHIIAPILLFVLTTVDLVTGIMDKDGKGLNKAASKFAKRALVCILLFFAGDILNLIFELAGIERCATVETDADIVENVEYHDYYEYVIQEFDD